MAMPDKKGKPGLKGLDIIVGMGRSPKLGQKQSRPDSYRGSPTVDGEEDDDESDESSPDKNMFEQDEQSGADELQIGAAEDIMSAIHERDPEAFANALKSFMQMM